jgi:hypothetical protein
MRKQGQQLNYTPKIWRFRSITYYFTPYKQCWWIFESGLLLSKSSASSTYYQYLDDKKKEAENKTINNRKRKVIDEILDIGKKKKRMENDIKVLNKSAE